MQVVDVISLFDLGMTTVFAVHMVVILIYLAFFVSHCPLLLSNCRTTQAWASKKTLCLANYVTQPGEAAKEPVAQMIVGSACD